MNEGVTEGNMMIFLGVIEDRCASLQAIYTKEQSDDTKEDWDGNFHSDGGGDDAGDNHDDPVVTDAATAEFVEYGDETGETGKTIAFEMTNDEPASQADPEPEAAAL